MPTIVPIYAAILGLIYVALSIFVIRGRVLERVSIGTGNSKLLERRMRIHANFAEYVPIALLLIFFIETRGGPALVVHTLCGALLLGRVLHVMGMTEGFSFKLRQVGMALTFLTIISASLKLLTHLLGM